MVGMLHSDPFVVVPCSQVVAPQKPTTSTVLLIFAVPSVTHLVSNSAVFHLLFSLVFAKAKAHHAADFVAPFTIPCPAVSSGQWTGFANCNLWTWGTMPSASCHQCYCTACLLQLLLSICVADCQHLWEWGDHHHRQRSNDVHSEHIYHDNHSFYYHDHDQSWFDFGIRILDHRFQQ